MIKKIQKADIDRMIAEALKNLKKHFRQNKYSAGWHRFLGSEMIETVATAQTLLLFKNFREDFNDRLKVEESLLQNQCYEWDDYDLTIGWRSGISLPGMVTVEGSCWTLLALQERYANHLVVKKGIAWLLKSAVKANTNEGWGIIPGDISRVYATCLALVTLKKFGKAHTAEYERALNWLIKSQNADMGWGSKMGAPSSITYTSRVILTLISIDYDMDNSNLRAAIQWLKGNTRSLLETKRYVRYEYEECIDLQNQSITLYHMPLQTTLIALILSGNVKSYTVFDGVNELIKHNNDHYWSHPLHRSNARKPLWAIFDTLMVCKALQDTTYNWASLKEIQFSGNKLIYTEAQSRFDFQRFKRDFIYGIWGKAFIALCICLLMYRLINTFPRLGTATYFVLIVFPLFVELLGYYITDVRKNKRR